MVEEFEYLRKKIETALEKREVKVICPNCGEVDGITVYSLQGRPIYFCRFCEQEFASVKVRLEFWI